MSESASAVRALSLLDEWETAALREAGHDVIRIDEGELFSWASGHGESPSRVFLSALHPRLRTIIGRLRLLAPGFQLLLVEPNLHASAWFAPPAGIELVTVPTSRRSSHSAAA